MIDVEKLYENRFKDACLVFDRSVAYECAMDLSHVDYAATAKRGALFVKKFVGERDRDVLVAVDASSSMLFGSKLPKLQFASEFFKTIFSVAHGVGDRVGYLLFSSKIESHSHPHRRCEKISIPNSLFFGIPSDPILATNFMQKVMKCPSIIFFVSDFFYPDRVRNHLISSMKKLSKRHDLICVQVLDEADISLPRVGKLCIQDAETKKIIVCNTSKAGFSKTCISTFGKWQKKLYSDMKKAELKIISLSTDCSYIDALARCLDKHLAYK